MPPFGLPLKASSGPGASNGSWSGKSIRAFALPLPTSASLHLRFASLVSVFSSWDDLQVGRPLVSRVPFLSNSSSSVLRIGGWVPSRVRMSLETLSVIGASLFFGSLVGLKLPSTVELDVAEPHDLRGRSAPGYERGEPGTGDQDPGQALFQHDGLSSCSAIVGVRAGDSPSGGRGPSIPRNTRFSPRLRSGSEGVRVAAGNRLAWRHERASTPCTRTFINAGLDMERHICL